MAALVIDGRVLTQGVPFRRSTAAKLYARDDQFTFSPYWLFEILNREVVVFRCREEFSYRRHRRGS